MARVIGEAYTEPHPLIAAGKSDTELYISSHKVHLVVPKEKPEKARDTFLKIRVMPNGGYSGIFMNLNQEHIAEFKKVIDRVAKQKIAAPKEKLESVVITPQMKAAATKKKNAAAAKKAGVKKPVAKKKAVKKKPVAKKKAVKKKATKKKAKKRASFSRFI